MSDERIAMLEARLEAHRVHCDSLAHRMNELIEAGDELAHAVEATSGQGGMLPADRWALLQRGYHRWMLARS